MQNTEISLYFNRLGFRCGVLLRGIYITESTREILFYLRKNQVNKDGTVSIMVRLSVNGEVAQFSSKLNIDPKAWDVSMGKAAGNLMKARIFLSFTEKKCSLAFVFLFY